MEKKEEKKGLFQRLHGKKKENSCCCNVELEEIPEEEIKENAKAESKDDN